MLYHVVTFELSSDAPENQVERICEALRELAKTLPLMRSFNGGADLGKREGNASFAMVATFDDFDGFLAYADHPEHTRIVKELILPHLDDGQRVQFTA
jgi:Stress responsive A/B Barrel Domain